VSGDAFLALFLVYPTEADFGVFVTNLMDRTSFPAAVSAMVLGLAWLGQAESRLPGPRPPAAP